MLVFNTIASWRGYPQRIRSEYGPKLISPRLAVLVDKHGVLWDFIEPGKLVQNTSIERFNHTCRDEILDRYLFSSLAEARKITTEWVEEYNALRPHEALVGTMPFQFAVDRCFR